MPKDRRVNSSSFDRAMMSPYACSLKILDQIHPESHSFPVGDESEWEEARCPICMEHPHNGVLLLCSSLDKGCRPFMCDTSYRHSNCLDQFLKSSAAASSQDQSERQQPELVCPLCRGVVTRWIVVETAREFMNSKRRNCSLETCNFTGNYSELRKHARVEHPSSRPSEASPTRQTNWAELERQRDLEDALAQQYDMEYEWDELPNFDGWGEGLWNDESFFDFASGMSDFEDDIVDEIFSASGLSFSLFSLFLSSHEEETTDSGSSGSIESREIRLTLNNSRSNSLGENAIPSGRSRSIYQRENETHEIRWTSNNSRSNSLRDNTIPSSRSRLSYQRENGPTRARSRSSYHRENGGTDARTRSSYHRDNGLNISRSRSSFWRESASGSSRAGSDHRHETDSTYTGARSTNRRENAPTSFRTRSSYTGRDNQLNSGRMSRYSDTRDDSRGRRTAPRRDIRSYPRHPR